MTGSLQVKNDKFYMVLNSTENGKRKQKWISTGLPVSFATTDLRDKPASTGKSSFSCMKSMCFNRMILSSRLFPKPKPGSMQIRSFACV